MKKRNLLSMIVALSLVGVIMIGATLAYLTDTTKEVVNTFSVGNVKIELTEPDWNPKEAQGLEPGAEVTKNPIVQNVGKNNAYVLVSVDGMAEMEKSGFSAEVKAGWQKVDANGNFDANWDGQKLEDGYYAYTEKVLKPQEYTATHLFEKVKFDDTNTGYYKEYTINEVANDTSDESKGVHYTIDGLEGKYDTYAEAEAKVNEMESQRTYSFDLVLKAYAIQEKGFEIVTNKNLCSWVKEFKLK